MEVSKRLGLLMTVVTGCCLLAACGGSDDDGGGGASKKDYEIVFIPSDNSNPYWVSMGCAVRQEADKLGVKLDIQAVSGTDVSKQVATVNAAAARHPDAIIAGASDLKAFTPAFRNAARRGIKIVFVDSAPADRSMAEGFVATDDEAGGRDAARLLAQANGGQGGVITLGTTQVSSLSARAKGFKAEIAEVPAIQDRGNLFDPSYATDKDVALAQAKIAKDDSLSGIVGLYGQQGINAAAAVRATRNTGKVHIVAFDATPDVVKLLRSGAIDGLVAGNVNEQGARAVQQAVAALDGRQIPSRTSVAPVTFTREDIDAKKELLYRAKC